MARKKRQAVTRPEVRQARPDSEPALVPEKAAVGGPFTFRQHVLMNVVFDCFCVVQLFVARMAIKETRGLYFFFGLLMVGFLIISIFDYAYDRTCSPEAGVRES
jgi:hypothetical protein